MYVMYIGSTHYDLHVGKKKNDHDETDYLTSFQSCRLISLSLYIYILHTRNRIFNSRVIKTRDIIPTHAELERRLKVMLKLLM